LDLETVPLSRIEIGLNFDGQGSAAQVNFPQLIHASTVELGTSADNFDVAFFGADGQELGTAQLLAAGGTNLATVEVPEQASQEGFAAIRLIPIRMYYVEANGEYSFNSLALGE
jgi:hypothetical protein